MQSRKVVVRLSRTSVGLLMDRSMLVGSALITSLLASLSPANAKLPELSVSDANRADLPILRIAQTAPTYEIDIKPGPLAKALLQLGKQTGFRVTFDAATVARIDTAGIVGRMSSVDALKRLLAGTDLRSSRVGDRGIAVVPPARQTAQATELPGIVIVGEKIERSYLETTTSVGVATADDIENYAISSVDESFDRLANVRLFPRDGGNASLQIRGVNADGLSDVSNAVPLVTFTIDGATQNREGIRRGFRSTWDLKQIEVLRGPQSSLYGRAALAGAVVIESNDPSYQWEAAARGDIGTIERRGGSVMISGPIVENQVAFRLSGDIRREHKDIEFTEPSNEPLAEDEFYTIRGKVLVEPKALPGLRGLFTFSHASDETGSNLVSGPNFLDRVLVGDPATAEFREAKVNNYIANVSYDLNDDLKLRSVSSWINTDLDISSAPESVFFRREDVRAGEDFTQDLRLEIDSQRSGLKGVVGVFIGDFSEDTDSFIDANIGAFFGFPDPANTIIQDGVFTNETKTKALYADLTYNFAGPWSAIAGLRYQQDEVRNSANSTSLNLDIFGPVFNEYDVESTFRVWLPKAGLSYKIDPTQTIAATVRRGYRQGFAENVIEFVSTAFGNFGRTNGVRTIDPEFAWTYELSYRKESQDKRLTFGTNVFYNEYTDQQITVQISPGLPFANTFNIGKSRSYGAEFEGRYDFGNGLNVFGSLGLLKTEIVDLQDSTLCASSGGNCSGNEFPNAPKVTFSFGGIYKHESGVFVSADASYTSAYFSRGDLNNLANLEVDSFFVVNSRLGYTNGNLTASIYAKNLLDEQYLTGINSNGQTAGVGDSRTIGVEVKAKF
ncbi:MAG: TonB-dependent receptor [Pseudomonadota bacterium]